MGRLLVEEAPPVFVESRALQLRDVWFSGIQRFEDVDKCVTRVLLYSNRTTGDGVVFREPVVSLLCPKSVIVPCAREAIFYITGLDTLLERH